MAYHLIYFKLVLPKLTQCRGLGDWPRWLHSHPLQEGGHVRPHIYSLLSSTTATDTTFSKIQKGEIRQGVLVDTGDFQSMKYRHW